MLEFWFNPQFKKRYKLVLLIFFILATAVLYLLHALPLQQILMFMATGIIFLICRYVQQHFTQANTAIMLTRIAKWLPIALLFAILSSHFQQNLLWFGLQGLGWMMLTICLFSPQVLLAKQGA